MVLYYSATGNTQYIAQELAKGLDDTCVNLLDKIRSGDHSELHSDKPFIICAPIIVCEGDGRGRVRNGSCYAILYGT